MSLLEQLLTVIQSRKPELNEVVRLLGDIGDQFPVSNVLENGRTGLYLYDDENNIKTMSIIGHACAHYQTDIHNETRKQILIAILDHLKAHEHGLYIVALFTCYRRFETFGEMIPEVAAYNDALNVIKARIYEDRLTDTHARKSFIFAARDWSLYIYSIQFEDIKKIDAAVRPGNQPLGCEQIISALRPGDGGERSPYAIFIFEQYFKLVDSTKGVPIVDTERLLNWGPLLHEQLGELNLLKLGNDNDRLLNTLQLKVLAKVGQSFLPTVPTLPEINWLTQRIAILFDVGMVIDAESDKVQEMLRSILSQYFIDGRLLFISFIAIIKALRLDLCRDRIMTFGGRKVSMLNYLLSTTFTNHHPSNKLIDLVRDELIFDNTSAEEMLRCLTFSGYEKNIKHLHIENILQAMVSNRSVKGLDACVDFIFLSHELNITKDVSFNDGEVMLCEASESDSQKIAAFLKKRFHVSYPSIQLVKGLTQDQQQQLALDLENGCKSRLGVMIQMDAGNRVGVYAELVKLNLPLSSQYLLNLSQAEKNELFLCEYAERLAKAGLELHLIMGELEKGVASKGHSVGLNLAVHKLAEIFKLRYIHVFGVLPYAMQKEIGVKEIISRFKAEGGKLRDLPPYLLGVHKEQLGCMLVQRCLRQHNGGFFTGSEQVGNELHINFSQVKVPDEDINILTYQEYLTLGIDLDAESNGKTLLDHPARMKTLNDAMIPFLNVRLQHHQDFTKITPENHRALVRIIAFSTAGLVGRVFNAVGLYNNSVIVNHGLSRFEHSFINWMIEKEYRADQSFLINLNQDHGFIWEWNRLSKRLPKINKKTTDEDVIYEGCDSTVHNSIDVTMGVAIAAVMRMLGNNKDASEFKPMLLRAAYLELLTRHAPFRHALRQKMVLGGTCLLLNVLKTPDQGYDLQETDELVKTRKLLKSATVSDDVINQLGTRLTPEQPVSPRDAVLYLALNNKLSGEEFDRIARKHLYHDFPLGDENHEAVKSALSALNQEAIDKLKVKLALLTVDRDKGMRLKFEYGIKKSKLERDLKNNLLIHVIMAGKRSRDPKPSEHHYEQMKECIDKNYTRIGVYSLFKQPLPAGEVLLGEQLQQGDSLVAPLVDAKKAGEAQRRMRVQLANDL